VIGFGVPSGRFTLVVMGLGLKPFHAALDAERAFPNDLWECQQECGPRSVLVNPEKNESEHEDQ